MSDHAHIARFVRYRFPDGSAAVYVEVEERGERYCGGRAVPVSAAVHALLNLGDQELFQVENRPVDWQGRSTGA